MNDTPLVRRAWSVLLIITAIIPLLLIGCGNSAGGAAKVESPTLPTVTALTTGGNRLQVVATTGIVGDVVGRVGGDAIDLTVLMQPGQDPHSYQPAAADLAAAADADLIFINGWNLEEGLLGNLATVSDAPLVPLSAGIDPLMLDEEEHDEAAVDEEGHTHGPVDPHVWQDVANVRQWVENAQQVLGAADPANAATYDANAAAYDAELAALDAELRAALAGVPAERRVLVANHDNLGYFARAYGFEVAGAVIPSLSTLAEPTAGALADLVEVMRAQGVCAVVVESSAGGQAARALERELSGCDPVRLIPLYTDALGPAGSGADSYTGMMRANVTALVEGLEG